jgi:hypothetical protein
MTIGPRSCSVLVLARGDDATVGGHDLRGEEVVAREPVLGRDPGVAAAEREAADAGRGHATARGRQAEQLRLAVELAPQHACVRTCDAGGRVDVDALHAGQVDEDAVVADPLARDAVPAAADRQRQPALARERDRVDHVRNARAARDQRRPLVDHGVVDGARVVVPVGSGIELLTLERGVQLHRGRGTHR